MAFRAWFADLPQAPNDEGKNQPCEVVREDNSYWIQGGNRRTSQSQTVPANANANFCRWHINENGRHQLNGHKHARTLES